MVVLAGGAVGVEDDDEVGVAATAPLPAGLVVMGAGPDDHALPGGMHRCAFRHVEVDGPGLQPRVAEPGTVSLQHPPGGVRRIGQAVDVSVVVPSPQGADGPVELIGVTPGPGRIPGREGHQRTGSIALDGGRDLITGHGREVGALHGNGHGHRPGLQVAGDHVHLRTSGPLGYLHADPVLGALGRRRRFRRQQGQTDEQTNGPHGQPARAAAISLPPDPGARLPRTPGCSRAGRDPASVPASVR